jgi:hypothetical protein
MKFDFWKKQIKFLKTLFEQKIMHEKKYLDKFVHDQSKQHDKKEKGLLHIGEDVTELLGYDGAKFFVKRTLIQKYRNLSTGNIESAMEPFQFFKEFVADESVAAMVIVKHVLQQQSFARISKFMEKQLIHFS